MKIIFLDIDGVLNSRVWDRDHQAKIQEGKLIDLEKVRLLAKLVRDTDAELVLHSGWRFWFDEDMKPLQREALYLEKLLEDHSLYLYDRTPDLTTDEIRASKNFSLVKANEIIEWLLKHEDIEQYVVLDDLELHSEEIELNRIKIDGSKGLTEENVNEAILFLNEMD